MLVPCSMTPASAPESVVLHFDREAGRLVLSRWQLKVGETVIEATADGERQFKWFRTGPQALALALVRQARWQTVSATARPPVIPLVVGLGRPSVAASLGDLVMKVHSLRWVMDLFCAEESLNPAEAVARLRRWFQFGNVQGRRGASEMSVGAVLAELPPEAVTVWVRGERCVGRPLDRLEHELSTEFLDGSLPPLPSGPRLRVRGYVPSTGTMATGREPTLQVMDTLYDEGINRVLVLLGAGGTGKTTVLREWLGRRAMAGQIRQPLVFAWSFYRQGYGAGNGQLTAEFYAQLSAALGVQLADTLLPSEAVTLLTAAMQQQPTLLVLDGLEVLQDGRSPNHAGIRDAVLATLLLEMGSNDEMAASFALITTRTALREALPWSYPEVQHLKLRTLDTHGEATSKEGLTLLELSLARRQASASAMPVEKLIASLEQEVSGHTLRTLVRQVLESLNGKPEWALLLAVGLFDRPPEWEAVQTLLMSQPPLPKLLDRWSALTSEQWEDAVAMLRGERLLHLDEAGRVVVHPRIAECLAEEFRVSLPEAWLAGHRRLCAYFAEQPEHHLPETILEMEPLFRAGWHGCQSGDFRQTFEAILFPRVARGNSGYPIFELGAYEVGLHLAELMTPDHATFAPGCDLQPDDQVLMLHLAALCLRYLDRLEEAYECEKRAWDRVGVGCTSASIAPTGIHLLRCMHLFGDLKACDPMLKRVARVLLSSPMSAQGLGVPPSFLATAMGVVGTHIAMILWAKGHRFSARVILKMAVARSLKLNGQGRTLVPGFGMGWHALLLLDMGDWRTVERAAEAGELDAAVLRNRQTGMIDLAKGRMLSAKALTLPASDRKACGNEALRHLSMGLHQVERLGFRWWQCAFHLALARHHSAMGDSDASKSSAQQCQSLASQNRFQLMEIDAQKVLVQLNGEVMGADLLMRIRECGYGLALKKG